MGKMRVFAAGVVLLAIAAMASPNTGSWSGVVSDAKCGAGKHTAACAKKCIGSGQAMVFVNDADKSILTVANPDKLAGHEGHHVKVQGTVDNDKLTVSKVEMLPAKDMK
jgi:hypothetical protein